MITNYQTDQYQYILTNINQDQYAEHFHQVSDQSLSPL